MANGTYNLWKAEVMKGNINMHTGGDTFKVYLVNGYTFNPDHTAAQAVANEISGTGYTAGGATLASQAVTQDDTDNEGVWDGANVTWSSSSLTADGAVIVDTTPATDVPVCYIDFGGSQTSSNGDFTINFDAEGIINLT